MTPRQQRDRRNSGALSITSDGLCDVLGEDDSMENLADELADDWDQCGGEETGSSFLQGLREGSVDPVSLHDEMCNGDRCDHSGIDTGKSPTTSVRNPGVDDSMCSPAPLAGTMKMNTPRRHRRGESRYKGSGNEIHFDLGGDGGISPALVREMANIEALARLGLDDDSVSEAGGVISRTTTALKDLGAQASIENGATRMITAYTSVASHRVHKTGEIFLLAHSLLLDRYPSLSDEEIDNLICELDLVIRSLQSPCGPSPVQSLRILVANTTDLTHSLRSLSDMIQESRQSAAAASRRLKNARDFLMELQQEEEAREEGIRYLDQGDWDQRICQREAQALCGDIVAGFETTCDAWRYRLFGTLSTDATPA